MQNKSESDKEDKILKDRFVLGHQIDQGGFGSIYSATDRTTDHEVVIKFNQH